MYRTRSRLLFSLSLVFGLVFLGFSTWYVTNGHPAGSSSPSQRLSAVANQFNDSRNDPKVVSQCQAMSGLSTSAELNIRDARIYASFISKNITDVRKIRNLSLEQRQDLERETGLRLEAAERVFMLYRSHVSAYNKCEYKLLYDPGPCDSSLVSTIIVVHSLPQSRSRRMTNRERLIRFRQEGYRVLFLVGVSETAHDEALETEAKVYNDIIWIDFEENYFNLTIKTLSMLRWVERNCRKARHLVKLDDDVQLNVANLKTILSANNSLRRAFVGLFSFNDGPFRNIGDKYYMPMYMYDKNAFPPFAHGPCYALTTDLLPQLNRVTASANYIHLEDVFVAVCVNELKDVHIAHFPKFISSGCRSSEAVAIHNSACTK